MNDEHIDSLRQARALLIEQRRAFVRVLAGPYDRGKTEQAREGFTETQAATRPWTGPLKTKRGRDAQSTIEAEPTHDCLLHTCGEFDSRSMRARTAPGHGIQ
jgi:hypothetical protein